MIVKGKVITCISKPTDNPNGGRVTLLNLLLDEGENTFRIPGDHRIDRGEMVMLNYQKKGRVTNLVSEYHILDKDEINFKYSCIAEKYKFF